MGMFDWLKCEYPLPDARVQGERFQTKSLDSNMESYTLTKSGRLIQTLKVGEKDETWDRDLNWHGEVRFYATMNNDPADWRDYTWYEYLAMFDRGQIVSLEKVELQS